MNRGTTAAAERLTVDLMARLVQAQICARMRQARRETTLTQAQMADVLKLHKHTVENVENNRLARGPWEYVNEWAEATGRSVEWLLHGREVVNVRDEDTLAPLLERVADVLERIEPLLPGQPPELGVPSLPPSQAGERS